jgi:aminopeptidase
VAEREARSHFYDKGLFAKTLPWTIVPRATTGWATLVFPGDPEGKQKLQNVIDDIMEVDKPDCIERWRSRSIKMEKRAKLLDQIEIASLHFQGEGTDLTVGLSNLARFSSAVKRLDSGVEHIANIPTYENYSTPDWRLTRGHVQMTRPVLLDGSLVEGLKIWFNDNGEVENFEAKAGREAFQSLIDAPGGNRLGEVALVGIDDSPIFQSGLVFQNTLLDENAACHIAFGRAYLSQLEGGTKMSKEEQEAVGCNFSNKHDDMMISDENTTVTAHSRTGEKVVIIQDGAWAGPFKG